MRCWLCAWFVSSLLRLIACVCVCLFCCCVCVFDCVLVYVDCVCCCVVCVVVLLFGPSVRLFVRLCLFGVVSVCSRSCFCLCCYCVCV